MDIITILVAALVGIICFTVPKFILSKYDVKSSLVSYIPTFCTSVGVFFSFGVLWWVLSGFKIQNNLEVIVRELSSKFIFSIIGILFSIGWSFRIKYLETEKEQEKSTLAYMNKEPHELLWELVLLQHENNNLTKGVVKAHYETEQGLISMKIKIVEGLDSVQNAINDTNEQQLQKMEDLLRVMSNAGDYMREQLGTMIQDLRTSLEDYIKIMGDQTLNLTKDQAELIKKEFVELVTTLQENMTEELSQSKKMAERIIKTFEGSIAKSTDEALKQQNSMANDFKSNSEQQLNDLRKSYENIEKTLGTIDANIQKEIAKSLEDNVKTLNKTFESLEEMQTRALTALETSSNRFKEAVDSYENAQNSNEAVACQLEEQLKRLGELVKNSHNLYDKWHSQEDQMKQMIDRTNAIANMTDNIDHLLRTLQQSANHQ